MKLSCVRPGGCIPNSFCLERNKSSITFNQAIRLPIFAYSEKKQPPSQPSDKVIRKSSLQILVGCYFIAIYLAIFRNKDWWVIPPFNGERNIPHIIFSILLLQPAGDCFLKPKFMNKVNQHKTDRFEKMPVVNSAAAGIDVGSRSHFVAIGQNKDDVKEFGVYTEDLHALSKHL